MEIFVLSSGSSGNAYIIKHEDKILCLDLGISFKKFSDRLKQISCTIPSITDILITHEHKDHSYGVKGFIKNGGNATIHLSNGTLLESDFKDEKNLKVNILRSEENYLINDFKIYPITTSHDAREPLAFIISICDKKIVYITDTGYIPEDYDDILSEADLYIVEANHDIRTLMQTPKRPFYIKQRIISDVGHLSNDYVTKKINIYMKNKKVKWIIAHISKDCNSIDEIERAICLNIKKLDNLETYYASDDKILKVIL